MGEAAAESRWLDPQSNVCCGKGRGAGRRAHQQRDATRLYTQMQASMGTVNSG